MNDVCRHRSADIRSSTTDYGSCCTGFAPTSPVPTSVTMSGSPTKSLYTITTEKILENLAPQPFPRQSPTKVKEPKWNFIVQEAWQSYRFTRLAGTALLSKNDENASEPFKLRWNSFIVLWTLLLHAFKVYAFLSNFNFR